MPQMPKLKVNCYQFKLEYYEFRMLSVTPKVTTKKISKKYIHKRKWEVHNKQINQANKKGSNRGNKRHRKLLGIQKNSEIAVLFYGNYFKYKWIKLPNQKVETGRMDKNHNAAICWL